MCVGVWVCVCVCVGGAAATGGRAVATPLRTSSGGASRTPSMISHTCDSSALTGKDVSMIQKLFNNHTGQKSAEILLNFLRWIFPLAAMRQLLRAAASPARKAEVPWQLQNSPFCPVCPWDGWDSFLEQLREASEKCLHVCICWFFLSQSLWVSGAWWAGRCLFCCFRFCLHS